MDSRYQGQITLPQTGGGLPSARSSIGSAVKVARTRRSSIIFAFTVFTGYPFWVELKIGERSFRRNWSQGANRVEVRSFLENVAKRKKVKKWR